jgi:tRNA1Val (adenine37-N6)-methyltransferase
MPNYFFQFKQFTIYQDRCAMKVTTDACCFGGWVAAQLRKDDRWSNASRLLDIGAGTGLLSLMAAQSFPGQIDAVELDEAAATQARENCAASPWGNRIRVFEADICHWTGAGSYDVILSNPPFYENDLKSPQPVRNLAHHDGGLRLPDLLKVVQQRLARKGIFFLLLPYKRHPDVEMGLRETGLQITEMILVKQTPAHDPFRILYRITVKDSPGQQLTPSLLSISTAPGQYSEAFAALLQEYYLKL